jgi:Ser/Thr protein kinase RdoA (MazF antagonist)
MLRRAGRSRYRCHEWIDGTALPWHGHAPATAAAVGGVLARLHGLRLPWSSHLCPERPSAGMTRWLALAESTRSFDTELRISLDRALPSIDDLETLTSTISPIEPTVGSHRDLHPTNVMRSRPATSAAHAVVTSLSQVGSIVTQWTAPAGALPSGIDRCEPTTRIWLVRLGGGRERHSHHRRSRC